MNRTARIERTTFETRIQMSLNLDGSGIADVQTGVGFLDHMLTLLAGHALFDLSVSATGDLQTDDHHTVEDVGICLGRCLLQAIGDRKGMQRYGHMTLPMDETLVTTAVDLGGRAAVVFNAEFPSQKIGTFDTELVQEFWTAVAGNALMNLHVLLHHGRNSHHISEAIFKSAARALRLATSLDPRRTGIPSTKGTLDQ